MLLVNMWLILYVIIVCIYIYICIWSSHQQPRLIPILPWKRLKLGNRRWARKKENHMCMKRIGTWKDLTPFASFWIHNMACLWRSLCTSNQDIPEGRNQVFKICGIKSHFTTSNSCWIFGNEGTGTSPWKSWTGEESPQTTKRKSISHQTESKWEV